ncbi:hypothetical protein [Flavobacterium sp. HBTb2-11-1]|uniref:hypothetical protein n=1 Tax=Flavobacterium sp. HBTb2-11-1 TaxID=2692212 RepID=UPI001F24C19D|nr:hypothetical protein [Flavobacterium sp. HBTb2-11-1]
MSSRRNFIKQTSVIGIAGLINPIEAISSVPKNAPLFSTQKAKWADGSRLVVSISMQFEAGGQPQNAESPFPQNIQKGYIDLPAATWYDYGYKEGIHACWTIGIN